MEAALRSDLAAWRRETAELYAAVRRSADPERAWKGFIASRSRMFREHAQSPLAAPQRGSFTRIPYFPYNPAFRTTGQLDYEFEPEEISMALGEDGALRLRRAALVRFELAGVAAELAIYWVLGYGGGMFLPFKDPTNRKETYGGGRYLYDTIKGADLGIRRDEIPLDFNFAYNPSCAYDDRWVCPLAPPGNTLQIPIQAGEKRFRA